MGAQQPAGGWRRGAWWGVGWVPAVVGWVGVCAGRQRSAGGGMALWQAGALWVVGTVLQRAQG